MTGERVHPMTPLLRGGIFAVAIGYVVLRNLVEGSGSAGEQGLLILAAVFAGLAYGAASWWFTRFRITADELQIDTGVFVRRSRRIRIERLQAIEISQPLLARLFGMAQLEFDSGGTSGAEATLAFLPLTRAESLRGQLLGQARERPDQPEPTTPPLYRVSAGFLLLGTITQSGLVVGAAATLAALLLVLVTGAPVALVVGLPLVLAVAGRLATELTRLYGFRLTATPEGFRVRSGLTDLRTTSIPFGRIQGVVVEEPLLWRAFGWVRVRVTIAGAGRRDSDEARTTSTLVPISSGGLVGELLPQLLDGADPRQLMPVPTTSRAAWVDPVTWRTLGVAIDDRLVVTQRGWLTRRTDVVPRAKPQSARLVQGPLQRRLGLASVHVDLPSGPVSAKAMHRPADQARGLALVLGGRSPVEQAAQRTAT